MPMKFQPETPWKLRLPAVAALCLLASCGGGSGGSTDPGPEPEQAGITFMAGSTVTRNLGEPGWVSNLMGVAAADDGTVFVGDLDTIRKVDSSGFVTLVAGTPGVTGSTDGPVLQARFNGPASLVFDAAGNLYVAEKYANHIRKISPSGEVSTWVGDGDCRTGDGAGVAASICNPSQLAINSAGTVYVASLGALRRIDKAGN
ncbi:MAG TPA: hypothetical protein VGQ91_05855, partial [Ideonella sp.]|nr:hypothetical protein [Ideonella sp.]